MQENQENHLKDLLESNSRYFEVLTSEEQHAFIENLARDPEQLTIDEYMSQGEFSNGTEFICNAFDWSPTPEGHDYWMNIANSMARVFVDYDVPPKAELQNQVIRLEAQLQKIAEENQALKLKLAIKQHEDNDFTKGPRAVWSEIEQRLITSSVYKSNLLITSKDAFWWLAANYLPPSPIKEW
jgi:hypothetical protein